MIFQWESQSATAYLRQLMSDETIAKIKAQNPNMSYIDLLSVGNGAIRPAGESYRDKLAQGIFMDNGNDALNEFLAPTLGYLTYQEEIIEFLNKFCGFTMGEADVVRRCVDENTLITMADGTYKKIRDISIGESVVTFDDSNSASINTVENVFDNGYNNCITVKTEHCNSITMTESHKVLTQRGWIEAGELTINDYIMTPQKIISECDNLKPNKRLSKTDMFLIGAMIGDGCMGGEYFHFTNSDRELIEYVKYCINNRLRKDKSNTACEFRETCVNGVTVDNIFTVNIKTKSYKDSCKKLFEKYGLCEFSQNKRIPDVIMRYPIDEKLLSLLGGLFSTDAGIIGKTKSISYYSTSKELVNNIRYLLLRIGIYSVIYESEVNGYGYKAYNLLISQRDSIYNFMEIIYPYVIGKNRKLFEESVKKIKCDDCYNYLLPREYIDEIKNVMKNRNISFNSIGLSLKNNSATDTKIKKFANIVYAPKTYELLTAEYMPVKVVSIELAGTRHVYDLQISENHNYVANNLIVHNCFAKKTGTEPTIPVIKNGGYLPNGKREIPGFIKTMKEKYNVPENESEKIVVSFLKVIEDASSYLFSKNHSDPYSWIGYICGYLRYYYPLEFITTALNIFEGKEDKSLAIIAYAKKRGIKISPIKFRHSIAKYNFNKETNEIYKGISSIKFMNEAVANELYELRENQYKQFIDLLYDLQDKTTLNSRQIKILIDLDFFEEFGDANYLHEQYKLFDGYFGKKQLKKDKLEKDKIPISLAQKYAEKETEKMFSGVNTKAMLSEYVKYLSVPRRRLKDKLTLQLEHLGYLDITGDQYSRMAAVLDVDTKYSPKIKAYSLKNGTTLECKIDKRTYTKIKLKKGDIILITKTKRKPKMKRTSDGNFEPVPNTSELWLAEYRKVDDI